MESDCRVYPNKGYSSCNADAYHRNIKNTLLYTQLVKTQSEDEYVCRVAKTVKQAAELIEAGFEYVYEIDGVKLFRKRK